MKRSMDRSPPEAVGAADRGSTLTERLDGINVHTGEDTASTMIHPVAGRWSNPTEGANLTPSVKEIRRRIP